VILEVSALRGLPSIDQGSWERRWAQALGQNPQMVASRPPNAVWVAVVRAVRRG